MLSHFEEDSLKTEQTISLENALMRDTIQQRTFGCPEVTIGWYGKRRVDFMKTNSRGIIWCYEIKVTESDFHSKHGHNFDGEYNYYVMPRALYKKVKDEIPAHVGVLVESGLYCVKKAKRQKMTQEMRNKMIMYMLRSMSREVKKGWTSSNKKAMMGLRRECDRLRSMVDSYRGAIHKLEDERKASRRRRSVKA